MAVGGSMVGGLVSTTQASAVTRYGGTFEEDTFDNIQVDGKITKAQFELLMAHGVSSASNEGLLPQPANPKYRLALLESYVPSQPFGGSDKSRNGNRYDSVPIANGVIQNGCECQVFRYVPDEHDACMAYLRTFDAVIVRCNPGQINFIPGGSQGRFDGAMSKLRKAGVQVWASPDVQTQMGAKDALCKIADTPIGLPDTLAYYSPEEFEAGFKKTMAFQPRVMKQNRGSAGEGIWIIKLAKGDYCANYGDRSCTDGEVLEMMEANDNHAETHTVGEFVEFCINGRTAKSGTWTSAGVGKYLEGGKAAGGQLVDQRFCPRIVEGELRVNMVNDTPYAIIHKKPKAGGISAVGGTGSIYTFFEPDDPQFQKLITEFTRDTLPTLMETLGLKGEPLPLWWTGDFINAAPQGSPDQWIIGEFNCSCVGISYVLPACCTPTNKDANFYSTTGADKAAADKVCKLIGQKALEILNKETANKMSETISSLISA